MPVRSPLSLLPGHACDNLLFILIACIRMYNTLMEEMSFDEVRRRACWRRLTGNMGENGFLGISCIRAAMRLRGRLKFCERFGRTVNLHVIITRVRKVSGRVMNFRRCGCVNVKLVTAAWMWGRYIISVFLRRLI